MSFVLLPGWGKTLVIAESVRYFLSQYPDQRVCVLAPTVNLVEQHASVFRTNFGISHVSAKYGTPGDWKNRNIEPDEAAKKRWKDYFDQNYVIVATPQLFYEGLTVMPLNRISMIAFDECHNATGRMI